MSAVVHITTFDKAWLRGSRSFEEDRDLIVWHKLWVVFVVYHVNALNVESVRFSRIICRFLVWLCFECQAIRHKEVLHGGVLQLRHYQIVVKQWNWQLVGLPLILSWILSINNVTDVLLILVAYANLDVEVRLSPTLLESGLSRHWLTESHHRAFTVRATLSRGQALGCPAPLRKWKQSKTKHMKNKNTYF